MWSPAPPMSPCQEHGICCCSRRGKQLLQTRAQNHVLLKNSFPKANKELRQLLVDGSIVVRYSRGDREDDLDAWAQEARNLLGEADDSDEHGNAHWLHIGLLYQKPFRPTYQELRSLGSPAPDRHLLEQTGNFWTELRFLQQLYHSLEWSVCFFRILQTQRPVATLLPAQCLVEVMGPAQVLRTQKQRQQRRRARGAGRASAQPEGRLPLGQEQGLEESNAQVGVREEAPEDKSSLSSDEDMDVAAVGEESDSSLQSETGSDLVPDLLDAVMDMYEEQLPADESGLGNAEGEAMALEAEPALAEAAPASPASTPPQEAVEADPVLEEDVAPQPPALYEAELPQQEEQEGLAGDPAAKAAAKPPARPGRAKAEEVLVLPHGKVTYYGQGLFTATCGNEAHGRCVLTRSALEGRSPAQGRPLAFLCAWLEMGADLVTKEEHWHRPNWPSLEARQAMRDRIQERSSFPTNVGT